MRRRTIDPKDVPQMFRDGTLWFGIALECRTLNFRGWELVCLVGFEDDCGKPFYARTISDGEERWYVESRFPQPNLRDGDPVVVRHNNSSMDYEITDVYRHFKNWSDGGKAICYDCGRTAWTKTSLSNTSAWDSCRPATPDELEAAGLDRDWFAGRRGIPQLEEKIDG